MSASSAEGRRFVDIRHDLTVELGGQLSAAETLQVQNIAGLMLHAERLQASLLRGEDVDAESMTRTANAAARLLNALKRSAKARSAAPDGRAALVEHMRRKREDGR